MRGSERRKSPSCGLKEGNILEKLKGGGGVIEAESRKHWGLCFRRIQRNGKGVDPEGSGRIN